MAAADRSSVLLELERVEKRFEAVAGVLPDPVLDGVSLKVERGESLAIVGPSGSGKSTLLYVMGGLDTPTAGRVLLEGTDLARLDEHGRADLRNRRIGFVFQSHHLLPQCSALENVLVPTLATRRSGEERARTEARARELLAAVGLDQRAGHRPAQLSGGECQRVAVARALVNEPVLLLADEPTGSLDARNAEGLAELFGELVSAHGVTLVAVTHSASFAERQGRALELREGTLHAVGAAG